MGLMRAKFLTGQCQGDSGVTRHHHRQQTTTTAIGSSPSCGHEMSSLVSALSRLDFVNIYRLRRTKGPQSLVYWVSYVCYPACLFSLPLLRLVPHYSVLHFPFPNFLAFPVWYMLYFLLTYLDNFRICL